MGQKAGDREEVKWTYLKTSRSITLFFLTNLSKEIGPDGIAKSFIF